MILFIYSFVFRVQLKLKKCLIQWVSAPHSLKQLLHAPSPSWVSSTPPPAIAQRNIAGTFGDCETQKPPSSDRPKITTRKPKEITSESCRPLWHNGPFSVFSAQIFFFFVIHNLQRYLSQRALNQTVPPYGNT